MSVPTSEAITASAAVRRLRIKVGVPWNETRTGVTVHMFAPGRPQVALCGADLSVAATASRGPACPVCDRLEDELLPPAQ